MAAPRAAAAGTSPGLALAAPALLHDLLDRAAAWWPGAPAVTGAVPGAAGPVTLGYAELAGLSRRAAAWLAGRGIGRGDRVVLVTPPGPHAVALVYGCARIGAVFALLHEQTAPHGLAHVLDDAGPALVIGDGAAVAPAASRVGVAACGYAEAAAAIDATPPLADPAVARQPGAPLPVDPVCFIYTSGSTGLPKAVVSTHAQVLFAAAAIQSELGYRPGDVVFVALPLSFDYGLYQLFLTAAGGAHAWLAGPAAAGPSLLGALRRSRATILPAVPSMAANLARLQGRGTGGNGGDGVALRLLTTTGAAMPAQTIAALRACVPGLRIQVMYGLTECKRAAIMPPDEDLRRPGASGRALPGTELLVIDTDGSPLPAGETGEIVVRGPNVMAGYWRHPELTAQRFCRRDGLFPELRTGDYGHLDTDGYVYVSGRRDDLYKSRGTRVSALEVEAAAYRVPGVSAAAVLPPAAADASAVLFAVTDLEPAEVLAALRRELEPDKVPSRCHRVAAIPLSANGKADRAALAALL